MERSEKEIRETSEATAHEEEQLPENVIRINFGQPRAATSPAKAQAAEVIAAPIAELPFDITQFPDDPLALKKLDIFKKYIENGMVSITLDPRIRGVSVPARFADRPELVLNFSYRFFIDDFAFDEHAVCASLSFSGRPFFCVVPWAAVKMMLSHHDNAVAVFDAEMLY